MLRYESFCRFKFPVFFLISHLSINIFEKLNFMCYEMDHFGKHAVSKQ